MKVDEGISDSWSEFALQDLLIDVAAVVDATESDRAWNGDVLSGLNVASLGNLRPDGRCGQQREESGEAVV
jgi:hypothetical protein